MKNLRNISLLTLAAMVATGVVGTFAANQEWWTLVSAALFGTVVIAVVAVLAGIRHSLRQMLTLQKHFNREREQRRKWHDALIDGSTQAENRLKTGIKRLQDTQNDTEIVLDSKINNLEVRLQKVLDDKKPK